MKLATLGFSTSLVTGCISLALAATLHISGNSQAAPSTHPSELPSQVHYRDFHPSEIRLLSAPAEQPGDSSFTPTQRWIF